MIKTNFKEIWVFTVIVAAICFLTGTYITRQVYERLCEKARIISISDKSYKCTPVDNEETRQYYAPNALRFIITDAKNEK